MTTLIFCIFALVYRDAPPLSQRIFFMFLWTLRLHHEACGFVGEVTTLRPALFYGVPATIYRAYQSSAAVFGCFSFASNRPFCSMDLEASAKLASIQYVLLSCSLQTTP